MVSCVYLSFPSLPPFAALQSASVPLENMSSVTIAPATTTQKIATGFPAPDPSDAFETLSFLVSYNR